MEKAAAMAAMAEWAVGAGNRVGVVVEGLSVEGAEASAFRENKARKRDASGWVSELRIRERTTMVGSVGGGEGRDMLGLVVQSVEISIFDGWGKGVVVTMWRGGGKSRSLLCTMGWGWRTGMEKVFSGGGGGVGVGCGLLSLHPISLQHP